MMDYLLRPVLTYFKGLPRGLLRAWLLVLPLTLVLSIVRGFQQPTFGRMAFTFRPPMWPWRLFRDFGLT